MVYRLACERCALCNGKWSGLVHRELGSKLVGRSSCFTFRRSYVIHDRSSLFSFTLASRRGRRSWPRNHSQLAARVSSIIPYEWQEISQRCMLSARTNERPKKRIRAEDSTKRKSTLNRPQLYAPFRALGLVTTHVPFVLQTKSYKGAVDGPKVHILTCLGNSWALWDGGKMTLLFVGE